MIEREEKERKGWRKREPRNDSPQKMRKHKRRWPSHTQELRCPSCDEIYQDTPDEDWIRCVLCELWWHENCSAYEDTAEFVCDLWNWIRTLFLMCYCTEKWFSLFICNCSFHAISFEHCPMILYFIFHKLGTWRHGLQLFNISKCTMLQSWIFAPLMGQRSDFAKLDETLICDIIE
jgi:hypothetical protein